MKIIGIGAILKIDGFLYRVTDFDTECHPTCLANEPMGRGPYRTNIRVNYERRVDGTCDDICKSYYIIPCDNLAVIFAGYDLRYPAVVVKSQDQWDGLLRIELKKKKVDPFIIEIIFDDDFRLGLRIADDIVNRIHDQNLRASEKIDLSMKDAMSQFDSLLAREGVM